MQAEYDQVDDVFVERAQVLLCVMLDQFSGECWQSHVELRGALIHDLLSVSLLVKKIAGLHSQCPAQKIDRACGRSQVATFPAVNGCHTATRQDSDLLKRITALYPSLIDPLTVKVFLLDNRHLTHLTATIIILTHFMSIFFFSDFQADLVQWRLPQ